MEELRGVLAMVRHGDCTRLQLPSSVSQLLTASLCV